MAPAYPLRAGRSSGRIAAALALLAGLAGAGGAAGQGTGTTAPEAVPLPERPRAAIRGTPEEQAQDTAEDGAGAAPEPPPGDRPAGGPRAGPEAASGVAAEGGRRARSDEAASGSPGRPDAAPALVRYTVVDGRAIPDSLTGAPGDPEAGARLFLSGARGADCRACHGPPGRGGVAGGPDLAGVGARRAEGTLRLMLVAPEVLDPSLAYHAYYAAGQRLDPQDPLHGGPRLEAGAIEDLVAWLASLTRGGD